jgi:hypothetical protein
MACCGAIMVAALELFVVSASTDCLRVLSYSTSTYILCWYGNRLLLQYTSFWRGWSEIENRKVARSFLTVSAIKVCF